MAIELDQFGLAVWKKDNDQNLFAQRSYNWVDRLIFLDESDGRKIVGFSNCSTFDFSGWSPMTKEEYTKVVRNYKDIYQEK